jgi:hypothetical protein
VLSNRTTAAAGDGGSGDGQGGGVFAGRAARGAAGIEAAGGGNGGVEGPLERLKRLLDEGLVHQKMDQTALSQLPKLVRIRDS